MQQAIAAIISNNATTSTKLEESDKSRAKQARDAPLPQSINPRHTLKICMRELVKRMQKEALHYIYTYRSWRSLYTRLISLLAAPARETEKEALHAQNVKVRCTRSSGHPL